ncbi:MAG: PrsW family intramembrane metalloprotease [Phycisphaerales bacterium]|nr:PrsW family intramembrane metalloprotease [Hyphomonadaceae bacterium]
MDADLLLKALIALAPVLILLLVFDRLDVFNLIPLRDIALLALTGAALALIGFLANWTVIEGFPIGFGAYTRYGAPVIEETLKAAPVIALFARNRLGFKIDAAIAGFAVGAGFSVAENAWYLFTISGANVSDWLVRGFGTAVMHGAATALFAIVSHEMSEKQAASSAAHYRFTPLLFLPGLALAMAIHSAFNHFPNYPLPIMAVTLLLAPLTLFLTLLKSDRATQQWLSADAAAHRKALADIRAGHFLQSDVGRAVLEAVAPIKGVSAEDVLAWAELKTALILRAEELILASHAAAADAAGEDERLQFARLDALEQRLGKTIVAAINSRLGFSRNDVYELGRLRVRVQSSKATDAA